MNLPPLFVQILPGLCLSGFGLFLIRAHRRNWAEAQQNTGLEEVDLEHFQKRHRRRMQASGMMVLIGILLIVGQVFIGKEHQLLFGFYWIGVLLLTFWLILLALADAMSIVAYSRSAQSRLNEHRRDLQSELERLRARQGNGRPPHDD